MESVTYAPSSEDQIMMLWWWIFAQSQADPANIFVVKFDERSSSNQTNIVFMRRRVVLRMLKYAIYWHSGSMILYGACSNGNNELCVWNRNNTVR